MNRFRASNGMLFTKADDGSWLWTSGRAYPLVTVALRELFRAEEDERLGRWRWPENPDYVVYPATVKTRVRVLRETGMGELEWVDEGDTRSYEFCHAARAYFDAHPEPKPWLDAKPGEMWRLTFKGNPEDSYVAGDHSFLAADHGIQFTDERIISARRIWPEVSA